MSKHVIETVTFKLNEGVSREWFAEAAQAMNGFVRAQPGFIARRLSCSEGGEWIEHIEWADMEAAKAAASKIGSVESNRPFLSAINGPTVTMRHTELEVAIN
ncbi:MAG: antibiotic biosynthesis monooxygenase family protein [Alphaproteobacteria bacterium]|jgi:hypothetical protein